MLLNYPEFGLSSGRIWAIARNGPLCQRSINSFRAIYASSQFVLRKMHYLLEQKCINHSVRTAKSRALVNGVLGA